MQPIHLPYTAQCVTLSLPSASQEPRRRLHTYTSEAVGFKVATVDSPTHLLGYRVFT